MGLETLVMPRFDLVQFCATIQKHKITIAYVVPPVVLLLAKHPLVSKYDLSSLRMLLSAAAPLTKDLTVAFYERLKIPIKQGYGLSETSPATCLQRWQGWDKAMGSVGPLLPNQLVKIVDPDEQEVGEGEVGEIWVKGPNIFKGYLKNEEQSKACMTDDGYYKTGDIGYMDANGNFYITDRVKELIKYKGFQVAPAQLEGYLVGHPHIDDVAVIGVYVEEQATEVPRAYVVLRNEVIASPKKEKEIVQWLDGKVANHKKLRGGVRFVKEIPKSATGKILRRVLKEYVAKEKGAKL
jgi:acyl-CoA synthetase (AMP-forming)/AMP-acid ligase II